MAYVLGNKIVKDTKEFDAYAYGITLPLKRGGNGYFEQAFTSFEQTKSNLKNFRALLNLLSHKKSTSIF